MIDRSLHRVVNHGLDRVVDHGLDRVVDRGLDICARRVLDPPLKAILPRRMLTKSLGGKLESDIEMRALREVSFHSSHPIPAAISWRRYRSLYCSGHKLNSRFFIGGSARSNGRNGGNGRTDIHNELSPAADFSSDKNTKCFQRSSSYFVELLRGEAGLSQQYHNDSALMLNLEAAPRRRRFAVR